MKSQELLVKLSEKRTAFYEENLKPEPNKETLHGIGRELRDLEGNYQDAVKAEAEDPEVRELKGIRGKVKLTDYVVAGVESRALDGAASELNASMKLNRGEFPLELLSPEVRTVSGSDTTVTPQRWLDRLFDTTAASRLGISFESVEPGVASYPVTTGGPSAAQRGEGQDAADGTLAYTVTELKSKRNAVHVSYTVEDRSRIPMLEQVIQRDMRGAMMTGIDRTIFLGDSGATPNAADIVGLTTAAGVTDKTLTQAQKVKADKTLEAFLSLVDGKHADSNSAIRLVVSQGSHGLWYSTIHNSGADNGTVADFLMNAGLTWTVRGDIDSNTANGDWGAFVGLSNGLEGAAVAPVWVAGEMVVDPYSEAKGGKILVTMNYLWNFAIPRASNFARLKYVT